MVYREIGGGGGEGVYLVGPAALVAAKFLPQRIRRILTARVEVAPGELEDFKDLRKPLLVERPALEAVKDAKQTAESGRKKTKGRRR